ncbi:hypothetical protein [Paenibacillus humicola]|uniref:hypothetical protein n=1 Tax=Paenibacillus humicola TaxID=3110540 RepID=UPI00237B4211|nr:hypothetical protein [Paenibacillus humicola]
MRAWLAVNNLSILYALTLFLQTEIPLNTYRLGRITGWSQINKDLDLAVIFIYILSSILGYLLTKRKLGSRKLKYVLSITWLPYYILFIKLFVFLFPITNPAEKPLPGIGLYVLGLDMIAPFYIGFINVLSGVKWTLIDAAEDPPPPD